jgi:uncharacterized protein
MQHNGRARFFLPYGRFVIKHRIPIIVVIAALTALLASRIGTLILDTDTDVWAPQAHPYVQTTNLLEEVFGGRNVTLIGIAPKEGDIYQPAVLAKIQRIQAAVEELPLAIRHNIVSLAARKVKHITGGPDGMEVRQMMEKVPQTPEEIARLKAMVESMPIYANVLVSPDGKAATIVADFKLDKKDPTYASMIGSLRPIVDRERDASVDIYLGGQPVGNSWLEFHMMKMPIYFGIAMLIIMAIQFWSFRSVQGMLLPTLTAILSVIWALGLMGMLGVHLDPINTTTPILIMAVAAGHAIQILKRYYEEYHRLQSTTSLSPRDASREAVLQSLVHIGPVMLTAGLIAAISFYSLSATGIIMVKHFGIFAGCGVLSAMLLELTLIPALRSVLPPPKKREVISEQKTGILDRFLLGVANNLVGGRAPMLVAAGLALMVLGVIGVSFLKVDQRMKDFHKRTSVFYTDDDTLNAKFAGTNTIQFLVETREADGIKDPAVLRGMAALQAFLEKQPNVGKTQSIVDLIKRMNQAMHADDPAAYAIPEQRDLVAQYLFLYSLSGDPQDFDSYVDNDYQKAAVWSFLKVDSSAYADSLAKKAQAVIAANFPPGVTVRMGGSLPQVVALNEVILQDKFRNMAQMVLIVFALSAIALRSLVGGLFVAVPLLAVILANFGLMGWLGMPLEMGGATAAAMAIGIGADYEIYLLFRFRESLARSGDVLAATRESLMTSGKAILFVALSIIGGYSVLQVSDFAWYNQISTLVIGTMATSALFALFFLRALMMVFKPRFVFGERREALFAQVALARTEGLK